MTSLAEAEAEVNSMTLRLRRRASRIFQMNEGRKSQIVLLDDRRLDIIIQPKLYSSELLDLVSSHFKLREKQFFGLGFLDETNHFNWLQGDKRVLDHEFPKKTGLLLLHFAIRFYVDTIGMLRDTQTVELFYLNARQALFRGQIVADSETVFELAAHVLQATIGDFATEEDTREDLKKLSVIPTSSLKEHPSIAYCEDRVICHYEKLNGTSRGLAIVNYMTILEKLPTYGIHYYDVKDKKDIPWWLGISLRGIAVYDKNDKQTPRKLFAWKNLENLYYRDKKFSIEVHGPKREDSGSQVSVSRRTFGASNVDVHAWFAGSPQLTKCIWSMAVAQHQFYLDRKQSKSQLLTARSMSEIAADLCVSSTSLPGSLGSDLSRSPSSHSLPSLSNSRYDLTIEQSDSLKAEREMYQALKARKEALEEALRKKTEEFKKLCLQEGELTGHLPKDTPLAPGEHPPVFRRRVGTAFSLSVKSDDQQDNSELSKLELEVELQGKITSAAKKLASDKTVSKNVRKQRLLSYNKAHTKLEEMEKKLSDLRRSIGSKAAGGDRPVRAYQGTYSVSAPPSKCDQPLTLQGLPRHTDRKKSSHTDLGFDSCWVGHESDHNERLMNRRQPDADSNGWSRHQSSNSDLHNDQWSSRKHPSSSGSLASYGTVSSTQSCSVSELSLELSPTSENTLSTDTGFRDGDEDDTLSREPSQVSLNPSSCGSSSSAEDLGCSMSTGSSQDLGTLRRRLSGTGDISDSPSTSQNVDTVQGLQDQSGDDVDLSSRNVSSSSRRVENSPDSPSPSGEVVSHDTSSQELLSPQSAQSPSEKESTDFSQSQGAAPIRRAPGSCSNRHSPEKSFSQYFEEDVQLKHTGARKKHFVVTRGLENSRLQELRSGGETGRVKSRSRQANRPQAALAEEEGLSGEDGGASGLKPVENSGDEEVELRQEEQSFSARVTRRKQTFILSRNLRKPLQMELSRNNVINNGYHMFERLLLEGGGRSGLSRAKSLPPEKGEARLSKCQIPKQRSASTMVRGGEQGCYSVRHRRVSHDAREMCDQLDTSTDSLERQELYQSSDRDAQCNRLGYDLCSDRGSSRETSHDMCSEKDYDSSDRLDDPAKEFCHEQTMSKSMSAVESTTFSQPRGEEFEPFSFKNPDVVVPECEGSLMGRDHIDVFDNAQFPSSSHCSDKEENKLSKSRSEVVGKVCQEMAREDKEGGEDVTGTSYLRRHTSWHAQSHRGQLSTNPGSVETTV